MSCRRGQQGVLLALVAMAQTMVVITAGIDLSVGMTFVLCNCLASQLLAGDAWRTGVGPRPRARGGRGLRRVNGLLVIFGRLQPIVATIASGEIYFGLALWLRPDPGGASDFNSDFADLFTGKLWGKIPASLVTLAVVALVVWFPFSRSAIGRTAYAVGSS